MAITICNVNRDTTMVKQQQMSLSLSMSLTLLTHSLFVYFSEQEMSAYHTTIMLLSHDKTCINNTLVPII